MDLPPNWSRYETDEGKEYYHNTVTNVTQWDRPGWTGTTDAVYNPTLAELDLKDQPATNTAADIPMTNLSGNIGSSSSVAYNEKDTAPLREKGGGNTGEPNMLLPFVPAAVFCLDLNYLQTFFDVSTEDVVRRIKTAMIPKPNAELEAISDFKERPDFYGPFWIATTVVIFLAATANFSQMLDAVAHGSHIDTDWALISVSAAMIYGCLIGVPLITQGLLYLSSGKKKEGEQAGQLSDPNEQHMNDINMRQLICVYGYSFCALVPASCLMIVPNYFWRWFVAIVGFAFSCVFIKNHLWSDISVEAPKIKFLLIAALFGAHAIIYLVYLWHFFSSAPVIPDEVKL